MLEGLSEGKLVTPEIMADRYLYYRTNEYLLSYLDHKPRLENLPDLPYERSSFIKYFPLAKIEIRKNPNFYKDLDPTNTFNPGIGKTSKLKHWSSGVE